MTVLEQHLDEYLQLRRTLGHKLGHAHRYLPRFVTFLDEHDFEFVTVQAALAWALEREVPIGSVVPADRMMIVRGFARYLSGSSRACACPGGGLEPVRVAAPGRGPGGSRPPAARTARRWRPGSRSRRRSPGAGSRRRRRR